MFRKILKILGWSLLGIFLVVTLAFTSNETKNVKCEEINIYYDGEQVISLNKNEIVSLVKASDQKLLEKNLNQINAENIEKELEKNSTIENAEAYKVVTRNENNYKGILAVKIKHRTPIVRIITSNKNYFLDRDGKQIPVSTKYAANVIAATGNINDEFAIKEILPFVRNLDKSEFWSAQIEHIHVKKEDDIYLTPLVGDHIIQFGSFDNYQEKFRNLKVFYENVLTQNNWNTYKQINLAYKNQVIGIKR